MDATSDVRATKQGSEQVGERVTGSTTEAATEAARRLAAVEALLPAFAARAAEHDAHDTFVRENVAALRQARFYSAAVPESHGGGGVTHGEMVACIRALARACPATALTAAMHQHVVMANVFNDAHGRGGEKVLRRVAGNESVLVSTGAGDWLSSNGSLTPTAGGYRFSARKAFASGCEAGDLLVTSGRLGDEVLHFAVPLGAAGVSIGDDWSTLGMRGTGSHTVTLDDVFVPDEAIALRRAAGEWHPLWAVIATVALPLIMAAYVGLADRAVELAVAGARDAASRPDAAATAVALGAHEVGELRLAHAAADNALAAMVANANDLDFEPSQGRAEVAFVNKTLAARAVREAVDKAFALSRGRAFYRRNGLERLLRDSHGAGLHPLQEPAQLQFSGRFALGLDPVG